MLRCGQAPLHSTQGREKYALMMSWLKSVLVFRYTIKLVGTIREDVVAFVAKSSDHNSRSEVGAATTETSTMGHLETRELHS